MDEAIDVEHTGDDETPTKSGMRYQRGVFRSWPPTERKALSHYMLAYYLPSQRRTKLFKALVFGCGVALVVAFFSALSGCVVAHWTPSEAPVQVEFAADMTYCQRSASVEAINWWSYAIARAVTQPELKPFFVTDEAAVGPVPDFTIRISGETPRWGAVATMNADLDSISIRVRPDCPPWQVIAHELGHAFGLDDVNDPTSVMHRTFTDIGAITPDDAEYVRTRLGLDIAQSTTACAQQDHYAIARWLEVLVPRRPCSPREVTLAMVPVAFDGEVL